MTEIRKLVRDGKVGVVLAKCFDMAGWYTSHHNLELLFLPELIELLLINDHPFPESIANVVNLAGLEHILYEPAEGCSLGNLTVQWIPVNTQFKVECKPNTLRDYYDEVIVVNDGNWITA